MEEKAEEVKKPDMTDCCDFVLMLYAHEDELCMSDIAYKLVAEDDKTKREKLGRQYQYHEISHGFWQYIRERLQESKQITIDCSWKNILEQGWISPAAQGMFKEQIIDEIGEEEYKKAVMKDWSDGYVSKDPEKEFAVRDKYEKFAKEAFSE